jgi:FXSXX-COOH protein
MIGIYRIRRAVVVYPDHLFLIGPRGCRTPRLVELMKATDEIRPAVSSALADFRDVPLAEMATLSPVTISEALERVLPGAQAVPVPVSAAFSSSI